MVKDGLGLTTQERAVKVAEIVFISGRITARQAQTATGLTMRATRKLLNSLSKCLRLFYDHEERAWVQVKDKN